MIRSTFFGFGTALSGMRTSQKSLDVAGNNITNMNTVGYTRQRLDVYSIAASDGKNKFASQNSFQIGQGVGIIEVQQVRDPFLDVRFRREFSYVGDADKKLEVLEEVSSIFDETLDDKIQDAIARLKSELQTFAEKPESGELEQVVKTASEYLTKIINQSAKQLDTLREQEEYNLETDVDKINNILEKIGVLNQNIKECEIFGAPALELRDERNNLIDELSSYMEIEVDYEEDKTTSPPTQNLIVRYKADDDPNITNKWQRDLVNHADVNKLKFNYKEDPDSKLNEPAKFYTEPIKRDEDTGKILYGPNGEPIREPKQDVNLTQGRLKGSQQMLNDRGEFDQNYPMAIRGIGYYEDMLDRFAMDFAKAFNEANSLVKGDKGFDENDPTANERPLFGSSDGKDINARNLCITENWRNGVYKLTTSKVPVIGDVADDGEGDNENILHMITLLGTDRKFTTDGTDTGKDLMKGTFEEFLTSIGTTAATEANGQATILESHINVLSDISDQKDSVSAVSLDEEGVDLLRYQKAYSAAARFATTLDEALDRLINNMGIVGR